MAIVNMDKLALIGLERDKEKLIETLMKLGVVEVSAMETSDEEWSQLVVQDGDEEVVSQLETKLAQIKSALAYIGKYDTRQKGLFEPKRLVDKQQYNLVVENQQAIWQVVEQISRLDEQLGLLRAEENRLRNFAASLEPWRELEIPVETVSTRNVTFLLGTVPAIVEVDKLEEELCETVPESYLQLINSDRDQSYLFIAYYNKREEDALGILKNSGFSKVAFKELTGTIKENLDKANQRLKAIETTRAEIEKKLAAFSGEIENLEILYDHYQVQRDRKKVLNKMVKTDKTFMFEGWLPREESARVEKEISERYDCILDIRESEKGEEHPILLKNHPLVEPFEVITELYSLPSSKDIDPNLFLAPFYFVFFGLMVGDAGYGLLMALATGIFIKKFKPQGMAGKLLKLIFLGGISTFLWGVMFGGWFGDLVDAVTSGTYTIPPLWFNPLDDPMRLLTWSFIFGGIHIFVGMGLKGYMLIKDGKPLDALFDIGSWYIFLIGLVMLIGGGLIATIGKYMALTGAAMLILTQGRNEKNIFKRLITGVLSLYNVTGFFSDVLSYSRLLALGLATGVIASVINAIGTLFGFSVGGIIILVIVFIVGTVFNILINVLGAFVHASRLQYVEFFGKFYEGGGKAFEPFKINTKFTNLT
jgi:V/A-type H+-transporting ATPase subunit I